jgi:hypothetical protein
MGTRAPDQKTQTIIDCKICGKIYSPDCDYRQGRCPHHPPLIDIDKFKEKFMKQPDAAKHFQLSMAKSAVRIAAGISLIWPQSLILAGVFLILAEIIGVAEEMV